MASVAKGDLERWASEVRTVATQISGRRAQRLNEIADEMDAKLPESAKSDSEQ